MHNLPYSTHAQRMCVWQHLFSSMKARWVACSVLFTGQDMSLLLIWMKLVVPTASANDNIATALLAAAQLLLGINGSKYLNFLCYARGPKHDAVVGGWMAAPDSCQQFHWYSEAALIALSRRDQSGVNSEENELLHLSALENETIQIYPFKIFACL